MHHPPSHIYHKISFCHTRERESREGGKKRKKRLGFLFANTRKAEDRVSNGEGLGSDSIDGWIRFEESLLFLASTTSWFCFFRQFPESEVHGRFAFLYFVSLDFEDFAQIVSEIALFWWYAILFPREIGEGAGVYEIRSPLGGTSIAYPVLFSTNLSLIDVLKSYVRRCC